MDAEQFSQAIVEIVALPAHERHAQLANLHSQFFTAYLAALRAISTRQAGEKLTTAGDERTLGQVVGHILAWDRFSIQAAGDILAGVEQPRTVVNVDGFVDTDGQIRNFRDVDEFNAYFAEQHAGQDWVTIQMAAIDAAIALHALFTQDDLLTFERLDQTRPWRKELPNGTVIDDLRMGWVLWIMILEHYAVDHADELGIETLA
jgi:hypothetical protein